MYLFFVNCYDWFSSTDFPALFLFWLESCFSSLRSIIFFPYIDPIHAFLLLGQAYFPLSIPIPVFIPSDRFAWNGPLRLSFTDRRNSSLRSSDTTGRAFGNPNRTLVPAPMVFRHKTLHLPSARQGKEGKFHWMKGQATLTGVWIPGLPDRIIPIKYRLLN